ncbi:MAG: hypothetical protein VB009_07230 [Erysipelotrichaceae bacterium]|nr:hypothetical protein [Erysipelotrichaceae bacterium]
MEYIKYVLLVVGLAMIMYTRMQYTKRAVNENDQTQPYNRKEKTMLYIGYIVLALTVVSIIFIK